MRNRKKYTNIKINPEWMGHLEEGAKVTKPAMVICAVVYILMTIFAIVNLINYFA